MRITNYYPYRSAMVRGISFKTAPRGFERALKEFKGSQVENHACYEIQVFSQTFYIQYSDGVYTVGRLTEKPW